MNRLCRSPSLGGLGQKSALWCVVLCTTLVGLAPRGSCIELIRNGSFEEGRRPGTSIVLTAWDDGPRIDSDIGFVQLNYPTSCGDEWCEGVNYFTPGRPRSGVSGPIGRGGWYASNFGRGNGGGGIFGSATQYVQLTDNAGSPFEYSAWFASDIGDTDYAIVTLEYFAGANATGNSLGTITFDGNDQQSAFIFGSANEEGNADPTIAAIQDNWTFYRATGHIPVDAASAAVVLHDAGEFGVNGYVDLVSLLVLPDAPSFPGDYNGNGKVQQADLDLVLLNWGADSIVVPEGWIRNFPTGAVDQAELDAVLLNWGNTQPPVNGVGAIPEPATMSLVLAVLPLVVAFRRAHAKRRNSIVGEEKVSGTFSSPGP